MVRNAAQAIQPQLAAIPPGPELPPGADVMHNTDEIGKWIDTHQFLVGLYSMLYIPAIGGVLDVRDAIADEDGPPGYSAPNVPVNLSDLAAKRGMGGGGFWPGAAARAADGDGSENHRSRMPTVDHRLFTPDERASTPVIGAATDRERTSGC